MKSLEVRIQMRSIISQGFITQMPHNKYDLNRIDSFLRDVVVSIAKIERRLLRPLYREAIAMSSTII